MAMYTNSILNLYRLQQMVNDIDFKDLKYQIIKSVITNMKYL